MAPNIVRTFVGRGSAVIATERSIVQPSVVAVMLTNGTRRPMIQRAIRSFKSQTYQNKRLLIWDTGELNDDFDSTGEGDGEIVHIPAEAYRDPPLTIGALRNEANGFWNTNDIIVHADDDDWSHPRRIEEQVALLQSSGKECVGYSDMIFWNETEGQFCGAWLYTGGPNFCLGTSLCYWRSVWEKRPLQDLPKGPTGGGEDTQWLRGVDHLGVSSIIRTVVTSLSDVSVSSSWSEPQPRMIASIHGGNTSSMVSLAIRCGDSMIKRVPAWDSYCRERMAL